MVFTCLFLQQGHRQDTLNEIFWLMSFFESVSLIGSQMLANWLIGNKVEKTIIYSFPASVLFAVVGIICVARGWTEIPQTTTFKEYKMSFCAYIFGGKSHDLSYFPSFLYMI